MRLNFGGFSVKMLLLFVLPFLTLLLSALLKLLCFADFTQVECIFRNFKIGLALFFQYYFAIITSYLSFLPLLQYSSLRNRCQGQELARLRGELSAQIVRLLPVYRPVLRNYLLCLPNSSSLR